MLELRCHGDIKYGVWERNPMQTIGELRVRIEQLDVQHATEDQFAVMTPDRVIVVVLPTRDEALRAGTALAEHQYRARNTNGLCGYGA